MDESFWLNQAIKSLVLYGVAYLAGLLVRNYNMKVNYTRKMNHFALFFFPEILNKLLPYTQTKIAILAGSLLSTATLLLYIKPIRSRTPLVHTMFSSLDRPEDRPYTLFWLLTQFLAAYAVIIPLSVYLESRHLADLILIPIFINGIGDGLAEPIGVRFGKHPYQTRGLFTKKRFTRTLEGSACVFVSGLLTILLLSNLFTSTQFLVALATIPLLMTLAEAWSPHTWDSPFMFLVAGVTLVAIVHLA